MSGVDAWKDLMEGRVEKLEAQVDSLRIWRAFVLGGAAIVAYLAGVFSHQLAGLIQ